MIIESSVTGLFRMLLIIVGAFVLLRFIGQLMNAKRNMDEERSIYERERKLRKEKEKKEKNLGKTNILNRGDNDAEDVDYEEL